MAMEGKAALITGGAGGIGRALAEILLEEGADVCLFDVIRHPGLAVERDLQKKYGTKRVFFFLGDVTSQQKMEGAIKQTVQRYGGLDILVNNAAIANERDFRRAINVNLTAVVQASIIGLKYMGKAAGRTNANIVNVASVAGFLPSPQTPIYSSVKHGVVGFSRALGKIAPRLYDIRVNALCPTFVDTPILRKGGPEVVFDGQKSLVEWYAKGHDRVGIMSTREVAESFLKLIKDEKVSGEIFYLSPKVKGIVKMPRTLDDAAALCKL